ELCFVNEPVKGQKRDILPLIDEEFAMQYLPPARSLRFRLALGTKPNDVFFLCHVQCQNLDNSCNAINQQAGEESKTPWEQANRRKEEGVEAYKIDIARDPDDFRRRNGRRKRSTKSSAEHSKEG